MNVLCEALLKIYLELFRTQLLLVGLKDFQD